MAQIPSGGIEFAAGIAKQRRPANGRIPAGCVVEEGASADGCVELALYVAPSENQPTAVLLVPVFVET